MMISSSIEHIYCLTPIVSRAYLLHSYTYMLMCIARERIVVYRDYILSTTKKKKSILRLHGISQTKTTIGYNNSGKQK